MKKTNIKNFKGFKFELDMEPIIEKNAKEATDSLKTQPKWQRNRRAKTYNSGWEYDMFTHDKHNVSAIVRNSTNWQLTWLLEHGHLIVNKRGGVGFASGKPHIRPVFDKQSKQFEKDMTEVDIISK